MTARGNKDVEKILYGEYATGTCQEDGLESVRSVLSCVVEGWDYLHDGLCIGVDLAHGTDGGHIETLEDCNMKIHGKAVKHT